MHLVRSPLAHLARTLVVSTATALAACGGSDGTTDPNVPAAVTRVSPDSQSTPAGVPMAAPLVILVSDRAGDPLPNAPVTWNIASGGGSLSDTATTTDAEGHATTRYTPGTATGNAEVRARAGALLGVAFTITLTAGPPSALRKFGSDNPAAIKGSTLTLSVRAVDQFGNGVQGIAVTWAASGGTTSPTSSTTDAGGVASTTYVLGATAGSYGLTATAPGLPPVTFAITGI